MAAPTVTNISPNIGNVIGGSVVTISGANFTGTTGVTIGGVAATDVVVVSDTKITCTAPAGSLGLASILVTNGSGTNGANDLYIYIAAEPTDTYIYLIGGRGDGFVPLWTGLFLDSSYEEQSDPYRDIFQPNSQSGVLNTGTSGGLSYQLGQYVTNTTTIYSGGLTVTPPTISSGITVSPTDPTKLIGTNPDDVSHTPPRQYAKVVTWRAFLSANGIAYPFRLQTILGIGSKQRE